MDCWQDYWCAKERKIQTKGKLRMGGGRQAHSCKGIRKMFSYTSQYFPNFEGPHLPFISENIFLFWMTSQIKAPTPLYFWKYFPFWMKSQIKPNLLRYISGNTSHFGWKNQIKPNFPLFLETLSILDEKPN
jgi:hypothetical protein